MQVVRTALAGLKGLLGISVAMALVAGPVLAQEIDSAPITDLPRDETLIINNPEGPAASPGNFNLWVAGNGAGNSTGLHQLVMDTLWFMDPDHGLDGSLYNELASGPWEYNDDFTEMTVRLKDGIKWSDGVDFTAADVKYTVDTQIATPGMTWSAPLSNAVASVDTPDDHTVHFVLKQPNARFHSTFMTFWNGAWIMPKHVFETVDDVTSFDFNPPVGLGPYTLHSYDPNGAWYIWQRREDWQNTGMAEWGMPGPKYVVYRSIPDTDKRLIEMVNGDLDMIHDLSPEGMFSLANQCATCRGWFPGFPYAHPDPTLVSIILNNQNPMFADKRVRWALALMLDPVEISMASYRGAATMTAIAIPPTGTHTDDYHAPWDKKLREFELDTGSSVIRPYNPDFGRQMTTMLQAQFGDQLPTDEELVKKAFGYGWWQKNLDAAAELLQSAGFTKQGDKWFMPDGQQFKFTINTFPDGVINRLGTDLAQQWTLAGVEVTALVDPNVFGGTLQSGQYEAATAWTSATWGGNPDLSFFLGSWHSDYLAEPGERQPDRNFQRWADPRLDAIIETMQRTEFTDTEANIAIGNDFIELMLEEMPIIPLMSFNVFSAYDTRYWTGFPTGEANPYANIVNNWANSKYILTQLKPTN